MKRTVLLGGYSSEVPPLPIPNREVKLTNADGTAYLGGRVGSRLFKEQANDGLLLFFFVIAPHLLHKTISEHRAVPTYYPYAHCFAMHKICGTLPKNQEEQEDVVLRKGATKACSFEEVFIYSHYIGVTTGFSELNCSEKQRKIVQTESRMN